MQLSEINKAKVVSVGIKNDTFDGKDMIQVIDSSGQIQYTDLAGSFGVQMNVNLSFTNNAKSGNFTIVMGSTGGKCYPFVSYNGEFGYPVQAETYGRLEEYHIADMIDLGWIEKGATISNINFFTSLVA